MRTRDLGDDPHHGFSGPEVLDTLLNQVKTGRVVNVIAFPS